MRPLPAVLLDLHDDLATGHLVLKRGRVSKTVDLVNGNPVSTASTPRDETLGQFLVASGVISEEQHRQAIARSTEEGGRLGEAVVALGILSTDQLMDQLGKQARHKIVQALRWPQGAWRFDSTEELIEGMQLRMPDVVISGLRETTVEHLDRLGRFDGLSFELTDRGKRLRVELKRGWGDRVVSLLGTGASIDDIERAFSDRIQARIALDAMILCDAVTAVGSEDIGLGVAGVGEAALEERARSVPRPPPSRSGLFNLLFEDEAVPEESGDAPLEADEDSGVVALDMLVAASAGSAQIAAARQATSGEQQRIKGADHYAVLKVDRKAPAAAIEIAHSARLTETRAHAAVLAELRDRSRVAELDAAYAEARAILVDPHRRATYDRELAGGELVQAPPAIDTELGFRKAEELMGRGQWEAAIGQLRTVIARSPGEADYHAALGWCVWMASGQIADGAETARDHLNQALAIHPDHAAAHAYKGRLEAALHTDDAQALFLLERSLDLDPRRFDAVTAIESLLVPRGELRRLERVLKRLLFRLRDKGQPPQVAAWKRLAHLYLEHLDDRAAALAALESARKLDPTDSEIPELVARATAAAHGTERAGWAEALDDPRSGAALVTTTVATGHIDAAFLAASTMVALGTAPDSMAALYEQHRVRGLALPTRPLTREEWGLIRHGDDAVELGGLVELLAPAIHLVAPMTLAEGDLDVAMKLDDQYLPQAFSTLRARLALILGVEPAPVYARVELGRQIHVVAADPPVLVAGDEALTAPERPELVFALARAMTFLWPGRAVGASRPGRVLRAVTMAIFREASGSEIGLDDPLAPRAVAALGALAPAARTAARAAAMRLLSRNAGLNLSVWARSLARTADRAGLLLCGDIPASFTGAAEMGDLDRDLQDFAYSVAHVKLRGQLGLVRG